MTDKIRDNFGGALNTIADKLTRAHGDHSGLSSAVIEYLGKEGSPGIPLVRARAKNAGLDGLLEFWRKGPSQKSFEDTLITALISEEQIQQFASETGLSRAATVKGLADILPSLVYKNAIRGGK
ncbi:YidB family protein [Acetobacter oeni]|uniref:DUF937 domain-containing protein n=1 Tax=Acetobacter oeni TaxID=304077 RepID=A0A511XI94_9PROT|nr:YidB family protein [Acetobacter oeni]MBB3883084.1 uncharacterized protein YidB (DUF937 family) [Acetobacter oeni]NHO19158.1 hypothetical protein [Acetobacter oeni]GBR11443.1 hypothetical protein AA21952_3355 [Acetobacter oeni LMG 21952]GEN62670.1 hypothetical protein AOE01nite_08940 [Acetobacter oeni]